MRIKQANLQDSSFKHLIDDMNKFNTDHGHMMQLFSNNVGESWGTANEGE